MAVLQWVDALEIHNNVKVNLKTIVFWKHITGYHLIQAKTPAMMIQLFNSTIAEPIAEYLCHSVKTMISQYAQRLAMNQQRFIRMNTQKKKITSALSSDTLLTHTTDNDTKTPDTPKEETDEWDSKEITQWDQQDTLNWITSLDLPPPQKQVALDGFRKAKWDGSYLESIGSGYDLANEHIPYGADITVTLGELIVDHLNKLKEDRKQKEKQNTISAPTIHRTKSDPLPCSAKQKKTSPTNSISGWQYKQVDEWSCGELKQWIVSLKIRNKTDELKLIEAIAFNHCTGCDFTDCRNGTE
eukprot:180347_1